MKIVKVVAAVICDNLKRKTKIFAAARGYGEYRGWWEFPGGKIEDGETPEMALIREIREELTAEIRVGELIRTIEYDYPKFHLSMDCFWAEIVKGRLVLKEADEARWLTIYDLESVRWLPADMELIDQIRQELEKSRKDVPYEDIRRFDLKKSFDLTQEEYEEMMLRGHEPEILLSIEETPGAVETVNSWLDRGDEVSIITGRPYSSYEPSREWLDRHGLGRVRLYCLDKYGRDSFIKNSEFSLEIEDYYKMHFDYAIEDSPSAFRFLEHLPELKVMIFDRPWNQECEFPGDNYRRCSDWKMIRDCVKPIR